MGKSKNVSLPTVSDCEGCGVCCMHMGYPSFILESPAGPAESYWQSLPADLREDLEAYIDRYDHPADGKLDGPCYWLDLDSRKCRHHQYRPNVCRDFQVGSSGCIQWRKVYQDRIKLAVSGPAKTGE